MDQVDQAAEERHAKVRLRSYQQEMLEASLEKNIIVAMDTGSGKTHIAIARIVTELERSDKLIWFLSPSVALALQQAEVLATHLPAYHIRTLTGLDGVDKWTDQKLWDATLANVNVVVGTPAVLLDALTHAFVKIDQLGLCVFDEAHRTTKSHPMNSIMKLFYHPARGQGLPVPHILGLTASPVVNKKQGSLETIESNLHAIAVTPKRTREELDTYVHVPVVTTVPYPRQESDGSLAPDPVLAALVRATLGYDFSKDPYVLDLIEQDDPRSRKELEKTITKRKTYCWENLRALDLRAVTMHEQLGRSMSRWYVSTCVNRFREGMGSESTLMPDLSEKERKHLAGIFDSVCPQQLDDQIADLIVSEKVQQLLQILRQHPHTTTRGIIFVEQRVQVTALAELLRRIPDVSHRVATFVGTSQSTKRKISVADLVAVKDQDKDLAAFRNGEKNLMIATNVLEEGIDVSACNLIICFDPPKNLVSFVQRRGRARQKDSHYYLFVPDDQRNDKQWAALEAEMKKAYMDDTRQLPARPDEDLALSDKVYQVPPTGALLTLENAKAHLYHFCSVSTPASTYVDVRPEFDTEKHPGVAADERLWSASVYLPSSVHADVRSATSSKKWPNEDSAIADAAFEAYVALHKAGLINDNLLPRVKDYGPELGQEHVDQPSLVQVAERHLPFKDLSMKTYGTEKLWQSHTVTVDLRRETICQLDLWLPSKDLPPLDLELHWNEHEIYTANVRSGTEPRLIEDDTSALLQSYTRLLLSSVHETRMSNKASDFPVLFAPDPTVDISRWLNDMTGVHDALDGCTSNYTSLDTGLVRIRGQVGHAYIYHRSDDEATDGPELIVTSFPKRKDFLHTIPESSRSAAYSTKQSIKAAECTVDKLPARYAIFAAFVPSIMHRMETNLLAVDLQTSVLQGMGVSDIGLILEAISAPSAAESSYQAPSTQTDSPPSKFSGNMIDYNRLEFLGDTILKHCTALQVMAQHIQWPESYLTLERDRIVRNTNLSRAALSAGLDKYILTKPFTGNKWRPPYISELLAREPETREMSSKTPADVVEALIGAAFVDGGLQKGLRCIEILLPLETWHPPAQCFDTLINALHPTKTTNLSLLEDLIGHKFQHLILLVEAITHVSFPYNRTGLSYERLEFLGDSVLDMLITPKLFTHKRKLRHWELHRVHEALVNSHFLGHCCMAYAVEEEKFDVVEGAESGRHGIKPSTRQIHLHDFLKIGHQLLPHRKEALARFQALQPAISEALVTGKEYPWPLLVTLNPPKFLSDLVESILGALYIDTRGDLTVCEAFVEKLGILKHMQRFLDGNVECLSPKERLGVVADREAVRYVVSRGEGDGDGQGKRVWGCSVRVGEEEVVRVEGCRERDEVEVKAAYEACKILEGRGAVRNGRKRKLQVAAVDDEHAMDVDSP